MPSFTERYHELTKYNPRSIDKLGPVHWETQPPPFKQVHAESRIDLLPHLRRFLDSLTSVETDGEVKPVNTLESLTQLLYLTLGLTARIGQEGEDDHFLRAAPSAGGLYPTEMYVAVRQVEGLPDGLYHYHSQRSSLYPVWQGQFWADLRHYFLGNPAIDASQVVVLFTGIYGRSAWRYKERAYRRILLDTGHALGNLLEVCRDMKWDYRLLGGFLDAGLEELFFLTTGEEFPLLGVALGEIGSMPLDSGQRPGPIPSQAILEMPTNVAMQVQQNHCERLRDAHSLRDAIPSEIKFSVFTAATEGILPLILKRRSCRKFERAGIPIDELRNILAYALRSEGGEWRLAPGKVTLHLLVFGVPGLEAGVYSLDQQTLKWTRTRDGHFRQQALEFCLGQELGHDCSFMLVYTADMASLAATYGDRGYRYACMDCGQIGERINLAAVGMGLGSSGIGGYYDDMVNEVLDIPLSHGILYITVVGVPEE